mgnify:CR=1 FL=1|jgi:hypothetical protein
MDIMLIQIMEIVKYSSKIQIVRNLNLMADANCAQIDTTLIAMENVVLLTLFADNIINLMVRALLVILDMD